MFLAALNTLIIKYAVIIGSFPLWVPFLKALYAELNDSLAAEGGLFGRTPTKSEAEAIARDPNRAKSPLVNREFPPEGAGQRASRPSAAGRPQMRGSSQTPTQGSSARSGGSGFSKPRGVQGFARKDQRGR